MNARVTLTAIVALLLLATSCGAPAPTARPAPTAAPPLPAAGNATGDAAARVNGQAIPMAVYQAQLQAALASFAAQPGVDIESPDVQAALRQQVLEMLIDQALVDQGAARLGVVVDEAEVGAEVERVRSATQGDFAAWLQANGYTEESFRAQARSDLLGAAVRDLVTKDAAGKVEQVHLRQILVETEAQARAVRDELRQDPEAFATLAQARSIDESSRAAGGDLGFVPRGLLPLSVEEVAFALATGQVSEPVQSAFGWHILKLEARDPARDVPQEMLGAVRQEMFMRWLDGERGKATIERLVK